MAITQPPVKRMEVERAGRFYQLPDGELVPSVTNILGCIGKPALINWAANQERAMVIEAAANLWEDVPASGKKMSRTAYVATLTDRIGKQKAHQKELAKASEIGSQVHALIEWNLRKELGQKVGPEPHVADKALWAFMAFQDWRAKAGLTPRLIEQTVWSTEYHFAGTMDLFGTLMVEGGERVPAVLDWKTGKAIYSEALLQNSAYVYALREMGHIVEVPHGVVVRFPKFDTDPEFEVKVITPEEQSGLFEAFLAVRQLWGWLQEQEEKRRT